MPKSVAFSAGTANGRGIQVYTIGDYARHQGLITELPTGDTAPPQPAPKSDDAVMAEIQAKWAKGDPVSKSLAALEIRQLTQPDNILKIVRQIALAPDDEFVDTAALKAINRAFQNNNPAVQNQLAANPLFRREMEEMIYELCTSPNDEKASAGLKALKPDNILGINRFLPVVARIADRKKGDDFFQAILAEVYKVFPKAFNKVHTQ